MESPQGDSWGLEKEGIELEVVKLQDRVKETDPPARWMSWKEQPRSSTSHESSLLWAWGWVGLRAGLAGGLGCYGCPLHHFTLCFKKMSAHRSRHSSSNSSSRKPSRMPQQKTLLLFWVATAPLPLANS